MPDVSGLVTNTDLNAKTVEVENKVQDIGRLVTNTALNTKIGEVKKIPGHYKYKTTTEFNKCLGAIFDKNFKK